MTEVLIRRLLCAFVFVSGFGFGFAHYEVIPSDDGDWVAEGPTAYKTVDQSVVSSTTPVADDALTQPMEAGKTYTFELYGSATNGGAGGFRYIMDGTITVNNFDMWFTFDNVNTSHITTFATGDNYAVGAGTRLLHALGSVEVATAGNLTFKFAQNTSNANAVTVTRGSWLRVRETR